MSTNTTYQYTKECDEISGFGGDYENACRTMVITGMQWLDEHPGSNPTFDEFENVYGMTTNENDDMKTMQEAMNKSIGDEATGAMMQACTNHVLAARKLGWNEYIKKMEEEDEE